MSFFVPLRVDEEQLVEEAMLGEERGRQRGNEASFAVGGAKGPKATGVLLHIHGTIVLLMIAAERRGWMLEWVEMLPDGNAILRKLF